MRIRSLVPAALVLLPACSVGPDHIAPELPDQTDWSIESADTGTAADEAWWEAFGDPVLSRLIADAVTGNFDLQSAVDRVRQARAARDGTAAAFYPRASVGLGYERVRASENDFFRPPDVDNEAFQIGFDASWEVDVFGGIRRSVEAADANLESIEYQRRDAVSVLVAEVARQYVELRGAQRRLAVVLDNEADQQRSLELLEARERAGIAAGFDARRAERLLGTTRAAIPPLRFAIRSAALRLAVLTGRTPEALLPVLQPEAPIPEAPPGVPVGTPAELLLRRPDLRAADRALVAANAAIGVAEAERWPKFYVDGGFGYRATELSDLLKAPSRQFLVTPSVSWRLFEGGRLKADVAAAVARRDAVLHGYTQAWLRALEDVERALARHRESLAELDALRVARAAADESVSLARSLFDRGLDDYLAVLDAQRELLALEAEEARAQTEVVIAVVSVYKALGGGWQVFEPDSAAAAE